MWPCNLVWPATSLASLSCAHSDEHCKSERSQASYPTSWTASGEEQGQSAIPFNFQHPLSLFLSPRIRKGDAAFTCWFGRACHLQEVLHDVLKTVETSPPGAGRELTHWEKAKGQREFQSFAHPRIPIVSLQSPLSPFCLQWCHASSASEMSL